jgi:hypothetical protein
MAHPISRSAFAHPCRPFLADTFDTAWHRRNIIIVMTMRGDHNLSLFEKIIGLQSSATT